MSFLRQSLAALRFWLLMTVLLGIAYPAVILLAGQMFPAQANGSLVSNAHGQVVGSALIGQKFDGDQWFQSRPSASDYSGTTSGGTNRSPVSSAQHDAMAKLEAALKAANPDAVGPVPADALTASASGLDPDISVAYALWQVPRVSKARGMDASALQQLIAANTDHAALGYIGQDAVNVTTLNLALSRQ